MVFGLQQRVERRHHLNPWGTFTLGAVGPNTVIGSEKMQYEKGLSAEEKGGPWRGQESGRARLQ